jgi:hypothetical protein
VTEVCLLVSEANSREINKQERGERGGIKRNKKRGEGEREEGGGRGCCHSSDRETKTKQKEYKSPPEECS